MVKQISDNEIYVLIKYIKSVLWRLAKRLSYIDEARCLKVKHWTQMVLLSQTSARSPVVLTDSSPTATQSPHVQVRTVSQIAFKNYTLSNHLNV